MELHAEQLVLDSVMQLVMVIVQVDAVLHVQENVAQIVLEDVQDVLDVVLHV